MGANDQGDLLLTLYAVGDRVELAPSTNAWMRGERFGVVAAIGHRYLRVTLDRSGRTLPFTPEHIYRKVSHA